MEDPPKTQRGDGRDEQIISREPLRDITPLGKEEARQILEDSERELNRSETRESKRVIKCPKCGKENSVVFPVESVPPKRWCTKCGELITDPIGLAELRTMYGPVNGFVGRAVQDANFVREEKSSEQREIKSGNVVNTKSSERPLAEMGDEAQDEKPESDPPIETGEQLDLEQTEEQHEQIREEPVPLRTKVADGSVIQDPGSPAQEKNATVEDDVSEQFDECEKHTQFRNVLKRVVKKKDTGSAVEKLKMEDSNANGDQKERLLKPTASAVLLESVSKPDLRTPLTIFSSSFVGSALLGFLYYKFAAGRLTSCCF